MHMCHSSWIHASPDLLEVLLAYASRHTGLQHLRLVCKPWDLVLCGSVRSLALRLTKASLQTFPQQLKLVAAKFKRLQRLTIQISPKLSLAEQLLGLKLLQQHASHVHELHLKLHSNFQDALLINLISLASLTMLLITARGYTNQGGLQQLASCSSLSCLKISVGVPGTDIQELLAQTACLQHLVNLHLYAPASSASSSSLPAQAAGLQQLVLRSGSPIAHLRSLASTSTSITSLCVSTNGQQAHPQDDMLAAIGALKGLRDLSATTSSADDFVSQLCTGTSTSSNTSSDANNSSSKQLPRIQRIHLEARTWPQASQDTQPWQQLVSALPDLQLSLQLGSPQQHLHLRASECCHITPPSSLLSPFSSLACLSSLALHMDILSRDITRGIAALTQLTRLQLGCARFVEEYQEWAGAEQHGEHEAQTDLPGLDMLSSLRNLVELELGSLQPWCALRSSSFRGLQGLSRLRRLVCNTLFELDAGLDASAPGFQLPTSLELLVLGRRGSSNWSDNWWESRAFATQLAALTGLQRLELSAFAAKPGLDVLPHLPAGITQLCLQLYPLSDAGFALLASRAGQLRSCEVLQVSGMTHEGMEALARGVTGLQELSLGLQFNRGYGDASRWAQALRSVQQLTALRLKDVGRELVAGLAGAGQLGSMTKLCCLELSCAAGVDGAGLLHSISSLTRLSSLSLQGVADAGAVRAVMMALPFMPC